MAHELSTPVWQAIIARLHDPSSLLALLQTCTALQHLADHEQVWQSVAAACWKQLAARERISYRTFKDLVLDDNRAHAAMALPLQRTVCSYRFQHPLAFYQCQLLQLQWWRATNSLRLYFDARGETDLRLPLSSSIAVVRLKHQAAAGAAAAAGAGAGTTTAGPPGGAALHLPTSGSAPFDLDAWATRLLVHAPDACTTFVQKPGHYKGVLIWHAAKATQILKALLEQEEEEERQEPPQQHAHQQCGRRSDAWEDWADWALEQQEQQQQHLEQQQQQQRQGAPDDARSPASQVRSLLRSCFSNLCSNSSSSGSSSTGGASSSSSSSAAASAGDACCVVQATPRRAPGGSKQAGSSADGAAAPQDGPRACAPRRAAPATHCLVFCYANDLHWCHTLRTPDYSITPLVAAQPQLVPPPAAHAAASQGGGPACPASRPHVQPRGQRSWRLRPPAGEARALSGGEEGRLAAAWQRLPGATLAQVGQLDQQLQAEQQQQEQERWGELPASVSARGPSWWA